MADSPSSLSSHYSDCTQRARMCPRLGGIQVGRFHRQKLRTYDHQSAEASGSPGRALYDCCRLRMGAARACQFPKSAESEEGYGTDISGRTCFQHCSCLHRLADFADFAGARASRTVRRSHRNFRRRRHCHATSVSYAVLHAQRRSGYLQSFAYPAAGRLPPSFADTPFPYLFQVPQIRAVRLFCTRASSRIRG